MEYQNQNIKAIFGYEYPDFVISLINEAKETIDIVMYDWRWDLNILGSALGCFNQSVVRAARRGVKIRSIVNSGANLELMRGVGINSKTLKRSGLVHAKVLIIDNKCVIIGSHNLSNNAFSENLEASVYLPCSNIAQNFTDYFNKIWL